MSRVQFHVLANQLRQAADGAIYVFPLFLLGVTENNQINEGRKFSVCVVE